MLLVDGFCITQLRPNGAVRPDAKGRRRPVKGRFKRCLLVALGIWPDTGRQEILGWMLAEGEDFAAWLTFLSQLEARINVQHGLELLIHDGSGSLTNALRFLDLGVGLQRCVVHKLRNIAQALVWPANLEADARQRKRHRMMRDFKAIWHRLRTHCRSAGAYHSGDGMLAMVARVADEAFQPRPPSERVCYIVPTI